MWRLSSASRPELWPGLLLSSTTPLGIPPHSQPVSLSLCAAYRPLKAAAPMTTINRFSFRGENLNKSASSDLCRAMTDVSPESSDAVMISAVVISPALFFFLSLSLSLKTNRCRHHLPARPVCFKAAFNEHAPARRQIAVTSSPAREQIPAARFCRDNSNWRSESPRESFMQQQQQQYI